MTPLQWFAEPFAAYGAFAGEGAKRVLGRPSLDPLVVLMRELVQNSWDARIDECGRISFHLDLTTLEGAPARALSEEVFADLPPSGIGLGRCFARDPIGVLVVSDRGTKGLGGPIRADRPVGRGTSDFVDLVFNMGQPRNREGGGGTYGFGKTISYVVSRASTTLFYTRPEGSGESRMIAVGIGDQYETEGGRYTGRHWWGESEEGLPAPVTGVRADELAEALGLNRFVEGESGLTVVILDPDLGERDPAAALSYMIDALNWHAWPRLVTEDGPGIVLSAALNGAPVGVRKPEEIAPLLPMIEAYRLLRDDSTANSSAVFESHVHAVRSMKPDRSLGRLAIAKVLCAPTTNPQLGSADHADASEDDASAFPGDCHHVALMRSVELVVKYVPGPKAPAPGVQWGGVFLADEDLDDAFAEAEPPTHDDWVPATVADRAARRHVNVALTRVKEHLADLFAADIQSVDEGAPGAARLADSLGGLIPLSGGLGPRIPGPGGGRGAGGGGRGGARSGSAEVAIESVRPAIIDGMPGFEAAIVTSGVEQRTSVEVVAKVAVDAGASEGPLGGLEVTQWVDLPAGATASASGLLTVNSNGCYVARIANPGRTAVSIIVRVVS